MRPGETDSSTESTELSSGESRLRPAGGCERCAGEVEPTSGGPRSPEERERSATASSSSSSSKDSSMMSSSIISSSSWVPPCAPTELRLSLAAGALVVTVDGRVGALRVGRGFGWGAAATLPGRIGKPAMLASLLSSASSRRSSSPPRLAAGIFAVDGEEAPLDRLGIVDRLLRGGRSPRHAPLEGALGPARVESFTGWRLMLCGLGPSVPDSFAAAGAA